MSFVSSRNLDFSTRIRFRLGCLSFPREAHLAPLCSIGKDTFQTGSVQVDVTIILYER